MLDENKKYDLCVVGGAGHIGLPLGIAFALQGKKTVLLDLNKDSLEQISQGFFPFKEENGTEYLHEALEKQNLSVSSDPKIIANCQTVFMIIGTPVDEYLNPDLTGIMKLIEGFADYFSDGQTLILRSTVYPGTSERINNFFQKKGKKVGVAFCPERVIEGRAFDEFKGLPQIISAFDEATLIKVKELFSCLSDKPQLVLQPTEAELAKLFSNAWRYIRFAVANQFFMIAQEKKVNYENIYHAMVEGYERNKDLASPGLAAGPCLLKDTMQLAAFNNNNFFLGHAAMLINEGLPNFIIEDLESDYPDAKNKTLGILGMTFKAESDDTRDSLSFKLRKVGQTVFSKVICHDFFAKSDDFLPWEEVLDKSDVIVLATPHSEYKKINPHDYQGKIFVDIWNFWGIGYKNKI